MQEVFEKIINKLEKQKEYYKDIRKNTHCRVTETSECDSCRADHYLDARLETINSAIEIVKQEAEKYNNGWIPCSERLPEPFENVLISTKQGGRAIGHRYPNRAYGRYYDLHFRAIDEVIAWKPLPAPYNQHICTNDDCVFNKGQDCPAAECCVGYERKRTNFDMCCESMEAMAQVTDIAKVGWTNEQIMEWLQREECEVPE